LAAYLVIAVNKRSNACLIPYRLAQLLFWLLQERFFFITSLYVCRDNSFPISATVANPQDLNTNSQMRTLLLMSIGLMFTCCENRKVKLTGLNDLVVGVQQIVLYENGEFYLELGAGGPDDNISELLSGRLSRYCSFFLCNNPIN